MFIIFYKILSIILKGLISVKYNIKYILTF